MLQGRFFFLTVPTATVLNPVTPTRYRPKSETKTVICFSNSHDARQAPKPENVVVALYRAFLELRSSRAGSSTLRASIALQKEHNDFLHLADEVPLFSSESHPEMFEVRDCGDGQLCVKWTLPSESGHFRMALSLRGFTDDDELFSMAILSEYRAFCC